MASLFFFVLVTFEDDIFLKFLSPGCDLSVRVLVYPDKLTMERETAIRSNVLS